MVVSSQKKLFRCVRPLLAVSAFFAVGLAAVSPATGTADSTAVPLYLTVVSGADDRNAAAPARYDFGSISNGDGAPIQHTFTVRNANSRPLTLERLQPSCGCTSAVLGTGQALPLVLPPGGKIDIHVSVNPTRLSPGTINKEVWVFVGEQAVPAATLEMTGVIRIAAGFSPPVLDFGRVAAGTTPAQILTITRENTPSASAVPLRLACSNSDLQLTPLPDSVASDGRSVLQRYRLTLLPHAHLGLLTGTVSLVPPAGDASPGRLSKVPDVPILGEVVGELSASPPAVLFGAVTAGQSASRQVTLTGLQPLSRQHIAVTCASPFLSARVTRLMDAAGNPKWLLLIQFSPKTPAGILQTQIIVTTPHGQKLALPASASVAPTDRSPS